jgi:pimeloyl-ACP methyl ester carboxylesterase
VGRAPRRAVAVVLAGLVVLLAGCTVGPSERPPVAVRGESVPMPPPPPPMEPPVPQALPEPSARNPTIPFFECTDEVMAMLPAPVPAGRALQVDCGEIAVPADQEQPGRGRVALNVLSVGAPGAPRDRPALLVLGDTAGESSALAAVQLAGQVQPALLERYVLVGLDRRGSGADLLDCAPLDARSSIIDADLEGTGYAEVTWLLEEARNVVQECTITLDGGLGNFRTTATTADIESLRQALGTERLSAIGVGDGAAALAGWARLFPQAVGRVVLDGPPHPTLEEPALSESRAGAAEAAFDAFAVACAAQQACPLGAEPRLTVTAILNRLQLRPQAAADGRRLTAGRAVTALMSGLGDPASWPALSGALAAVDRGEPGPLLDLLEPVAGSGGRFDTMLATSCNDTRRRLAPAEVADLYDRWSGQFPIFGGTMALHLLACAPWPTGGPPPPGGPAEGAPPILVIGTTADPRNPADGARTTADSLASGRYLNWQGAGTGAYPRTACVQNVVDADLLDGVIPQPEVLCPP